MKYLPQRTTAIAWLSFSVLVQLGMGARATADQEFGTNYPPAETKPEHPRISLGGLENWVIPPRSFPGIAARPDPTKIDSFPLAPFQSLIPAITPQTPRRRAAALRLTEDGRKLLRERRHDQALVRFERAIALEASAYNYYYLALAHHRLAHYRDSLNFLDVAESWLGIDPRWMAEISALRRDNLRVLEASAPDGTSLMPASLQESSTAQANSANQPEAGQLLLGLDLVVGLFLVLCIVWSLGYGTLPRSGEN